MKDWLIVIVSVLILLIVIDGIRRKRNERMGNIKVSRSLKKSLKHRHEVESIIDEKPDYSSEFPNGGARVVSRTESSHSMTKSAQEKKIAPRITPTEPVSIPAPAPKPVKAKVKTKMQAQAPQQMRLPEQVSLNLGESIPLLMESIAEDELKAARKTQRVEPSISAIDESLLNHEELVQEKFDQEDLYKVENNNNINEEINESWEDSEEGFDYEPDDRDYESDDHEDEDYSNEGYEEDIADSASAEPEPQEPEEVIIISVMAHKGQMFYGVDLLDIVLKCGMRFGTMDIFHRYSDAKGDGALLFSLVNMVKPGSFDLDAMEEFQTPGVSLFMTLPIKADSLNAFELMIETAHAIADALDGELKDDQRSVLTKQTVEHCRQRIRDYERKRLFNRNR
jgi:cell division protein ZipA